MSPQGGVVLSRPQREILECAARVESEMWLLPLDSGILTAMDVAEGFRLWEDEDFVYLTRHGETVATFSTIGATKQSIQEKIIKCSARV